MPISFANIPQNIKVPLYWVEVDPSMAGLPSINLRALLVGVMTSGGNATKDVPIPIGSQAQADQAFGQGSELGRMFQAYYANNFANEVWGLPVQEPTGGTAATGTITVATAATGVRHHSFVRRRQSRPGSRVAVRHAGDDRREHRLGHQ
jgi:phage tail sheath gpL-like